MFSSNSSIEFPDNHYNNLRKTVIELLDAEEYPQSFGSNPKSNPLSLAPSASSISIHKQAGGINPSPSAVAISETQYKQPSGIMLPLIMPPELESLVSELETNFN